MTSDSTVKRDIIFYLPDLGCGGVEKVFLALAENFANSGASVIFLVGNRSGDLKDAFPENIAIINLLAKSRVQQVKKLTKFLNERRHKDFVVLTGGEITNIVVMISGILSSSLSKIVPSIRSTISIPLNQKSILVRKLIQIFFFFTLKKVHKIICNSEYAARELENFFKCPEQKIAVIYNPINFDKLRLLASQSSLLPESFDPNLLTICSVGSLTRLKSQITLLQALGKIFENSKVNVILVGEGPERATLQEFINDNGLNENVILKGFQENPYPYIKMSDIYINTSITEGCPNAIQEALCLGVPVIATDSPGGTSEVLSSGRRGVLVPVNSSRHIANAVLAFMKGRAQYDKDFDSLESEYGDISISKKYLTILNDSMRPFN